MPVAQATAARRRIGLLGMYASANLGDTAIQTAVMRALSARRPNLEFVGICTDPADAVQTFGMRALPVSGLGGMLMPGVGGAVVPAAAPRWADVSAWPTPLRLGVSAWRIDRQVRDLDMLLISGSGQIDDFWGGAWEQPFRLLAWSAATRRQRKPVAVFGVGVDQLLTRLGTGLCRRALALAQLRVVRDGGSLDALRAMGLGGETDVCPDPAFHLQAHMTTAGLRADEPPFAVISPISRQAWPGAAPTRYERYLAALAAAAEHLQRRGIEVRFVCSQTRMDPPVVDRVRQAMRSHSSATRFVEVKTVDGYLQAVGGAQLVVASRLHALILALVAGTPVVAVSYARKVSRQMQESGLAEHMLDLPQVEGATLCACIDRVLVDQDALRARIATMAADFRQQLDLRFDRLAALIPR